MTVSDYGTAAEDGKIKPTIESRPVWLLIYRNVPDPVGGFGAINGTPPPLPVDLEKYDHLANVVAIFDAQTGEQILGDVYGAIQPADSPSADTSTKPQG
jgi:hypothetical protein